MTNSKYTIDAEKVESLIQEHISFFGREKALTVLKYNRKKCEQAFNDADVVSVLDAVFEEFGIDYGFLVHGSRMSNKRVLALKICSYLLFKVRKVKQWKIMLVLNRDRSFLHSYKREIEATTDSYTVKLKEKLTKKLS